MQVDPFPPRPRSHRPSASGPAPTHAIDRRVILAGAVGSIIEYYDFGIYGYLSASLASVFFVHGDPAAALLATFATFAAAFVLRPLGGLIFGHIGDRIGRKKTLAATVIAMALATFAIGVLPSYAAVGAFAAVLLVAGRCVQGVASGGEIGGAASYVAECSPPHRRGLLCSTTQLGALTGALLASAVVTLFTTVLGDETMKAWGWRIPFLIGLPLGLVGLWIRARLEDSPQFMDLAERGEVAKAPVLQLFASNRAALARTFGLSVLLFAAYYVVYVYAATHLQKTGGFSALTAFWSTIATLAVSCVLMPVFGALSDRVGRKPIFFGASVATLVLVFPGFMAMDAHGTALAVLAQIVLGIPESALMAVAFSTFAEMLPAQVRYSGIALGFNLASMAVGGTAPYICTWLINKTGDPLCPAWFLAGTAVITLATTFTLRESAGTSLRTS